MERTPTTPAPDRRGRRPVRHQAARAANGCGWRSSSASRCSIFGFLVLTVVDQWSEIQDKGVHFHVLWLIPAFIILPVFYVLSALGWDLILRFLGYRIGVGRAQVAWGQPLLARYVPGSVLYVLGRVLLSERAGVPRRITIASIVYEQAISATSAIVFAAYFFINHPDLAGPAAALGGAAADPGGDRAPAPAGLRPARQPGAARLRPRAAAGGDLAARRARPARLLPAQLGRDRGRHLLRRPLGQLRSRSTTSSSSARPRRSATSRRW